MSAEWLVAPGYEPVRDAFLAGKGTLGLGGGAYCAYVDGTPVIDLWGGTARPGQPWEAGTSTVIMSASKGFASLCLQILIDRGQLDVDTVVADVWPEFAQNGKGGITVRHFLQHTAGVLGFDGQHAVTRHDGTGWDDYKAIADGLAASAPSWPPGTKHGYHGISIGWLMGEVVQRVTGRSLGTFFHEEVAVPLQLEAWIGTPEEELARVAQVHNIRTDHLPKPVQRLHGVLSGAMRDPETLLGRSFIAHEGRSVLDEIHTIVNTSAMLRAEFPAGGATSTARALARLWALMGAGGELDGIRLLSPEIVRAWSTVVQNEPDATMTGVPLPRMAAGLANARTPRTLGYLGNMVIPGVGRRFGPNPDAYGAEGAGGQESFCDPASKIAVGFVRSELAMIEVLQPALTDVLYRCARAQGHDVFVPAPPKRGARALDRTVGSYLRRRLAVPTA